MGVDVSAFSPEHRSGNLRSNLGGEPVLLFVGRLAAKKGAQYLIRAVPEILNRFPNLRVALVGSGPEENHVREEITRLGLQKTVVMLGKIDQDSIPECMADADLFVMPSIVTETGDTEGLPVVLMEALSSGVPVVSTNVGGVSDLVSHRETGLLVRERDSEDLARNCIAMLQSEDLRRTTVQRGRRLVEDRFSWPIVARKFEKVFQDALKPTPLSEALVPPGGDHETGRVGTGSAS